MNELMRPSFKSFRLFSLLVVSLIAGAMQQPTATQAQDDTRRDIISEDFLMSRPAKRNATKAPTKPRSTYRQASSTPTRQSDQPHLQVGLTIWKLEPVTTAERRSVSERDRSGTGWTRVEADAQFREGDALRLSIESPRAGYLYVVDRDSLADGSAGESNLIFPTEGEDNRLEPGKLIDIPAPGDVPFRATPKPNQTGELLTFIVTSSPLALPLSKRPLPISQTQLSDWQQKWGAEGDRFEMNGGAGQPRTREEQRAASATDTRQLTREDPLPQTVYSLVPKSRNALLFNLVLSYVR
jgi:hypothetical protein